MVWLWNGILLVKGDWNGSGMHANFCGAARDPGGEEVHTKICEEFGKNIQEHISVYGADNDQRLTGSRDSSIDKFSYGVSDRGASIRIPVATIQNGWKAVLRTGVRLPMAIPIRLRRSSSRPPRRHLPKALIHNKNSRPAGKLSVFLCLSKGKVGVFF